MNGSYPNFEHTAEKLKKFLRAKGTFTILLTDKTIIHHHPKDSEDFQKWLAENEIEDLRNTQRK